MLRGFNLLDPALGVQSRDRPEHAAAVGRPRHPRALDQSADHGPATTAPSPPSFTRPFLSPKRPRRTGFWRRGRTSARSCWCRKPCCATMSYEISLRRAHVTEPGWRSPGWPSRQRWPASAPERRAAAPGTGPLTISSPAFANGAPIPVRLHLQGRGRLAAVDVVGAVGGGACRRRPRCRQRRVRPLDRDRNRARFWQHRATVNPRRRNRPAELAGQPGYKGPCPPAGTGTHHYRFTLYQLPNDYQLPGGLAGVQAAQTIAGAATAQAQLVGTFGG